MQIGKGGWTWVNLWAAWCTPCKEKMSWLRSWQQKLGAGGRFRVLFVSIDDDERQLYRFLDAQLAGGVRSTCWLPSGHKRGDFLKEAHIDEDIALPVQLLVDPKGEVCCVVHGAIVDSDLSQVAKIVGG